MALRSVDPATIEAEIDHIRSLGLDALRAPAARDIRGRSARPLWELCHALLCRFED